jgi:hypothetical protein
VKGNLVDRAIPLDQALFGCAVRLYLKDVMAITKMRF